MKNGSYNACFLWKRGAAGELPKPRFPRKVAANGVSRLG